MEKSSKRILQPMIKFLLPLVLLFTACNDSKKQDTKSAKRKINSSTAATPDIFTEPAFDFNYATQKARCQQLYGQLQKNRTAANEKKLISFITDSLLPCWYGTPWDYNGTTEVPGKGKIACGYFVTTTLRDAGMKINRVKLAQCVSENLLWDLCKDFKRYSDKPLNYFVNDVRKTGYGLYIVGLDNHTGYLFHDGREVWFIHSGVYPPKCTIKEKAINSITLKNSRYRVFGRIVFNK